MSFLGKLQQIQVKQAAQDVLQSEQNIRMHVGSLVQVVGIDIQYNIPMDFKDPEAPKTLSRTIFLLQDGSALYSFTQASLNNAEEVVRVIGNGPWPEAVPMRVKERDTVWGQTQWAAVELA